MYAKPTKYIYRHSNAIVAHGSCMCQDCIAEGGKYVMLRMHNIEH